jgi:hypothetical protein
MRSSVVRTDSSNGGSRFADAGVLGGHYQAATTSAS